MKELKFALIGCGFWSQFQLAAWQELEGARCVALYNRTRSKAEELGKRFNISSIYDDLDDLLRSEELDFVDIVTGEDTHADFTCRAAAKGLHVISQKPMARNTEEAETMVKVCNDAGVKLFIHENWRFQSGLRALGEHLKKGGIGKVFRARLDMRSGFPVFENQPFLATIEKFILMDLGSHLLDTARWLFGEPENLYCITKKVHEDIRGEDVATILMQAGGASISVNMSYAENYYEVDHFPETFAFVEGANGSLELGPGGVIRETTKEGTQTFPYPPPQYKWADPRYAVVHSSIVPCNAQILQDLFDREAAETTGFDNLKTVKLVQACYDSSSSNSLISLIDS